MAKVFHLVCEEEELSQFERDARMDEGGQHVVEVVYVHLHCVGVDDDVVQIGEACIRLVPREYEVQSPLEGSWCVLKAEGHSFVAVTLRGRRRLSRPDLPGGLVFASTRNSRLELRIRSPFEASRYTRPSAGVSKIYRC